MVWYGWMRAWQTVDFNPSLSHESEVPLYRQLYEQIALRIRSGELARGERLPATRELAGLLGLNRTTVSAAYELLESEGLIAGQVGRGSFVTGEQAAPAAASIGRACWNAPTPGRWPAGGFGQRGDQLRDVAALARAVPAGRVPRQLRGGAARRDLADILQLGSPGGYEPLRRYLLDEARAPAAGRPWRRPAHHQRLPAGARSDRPGAAAARRTVAVEDPVYPGLKNLLTGMGAQLLGIPVGADGMDIAQLERVLERERPRFLVVTSNFQNPTGATLPLAARRALLEAARAAGVPVVENDAYGELRYSGEALPALKQLDDTAARCCCGVFRRSVSGAARRLGARARSR